MTSPDLPQHPPANSADGDANTPEAAHAPQTHATPESAEPRANAGAPNAAASGSGTDADDDGPQPGNEKVDTEHADDEDGEGPAPGNERFPQKPGGQAAGGG